MVTYYLLLVWRAAKYYMTLGISFQFQRTIRYALQPIVSHTSEDLVYRTNIISFIIYYVVTYVRSVVSSF